MVTSSYIFFIINFGISTLTFQREIKKSFFLWNINLIIHHFLISSYKYIKWLRFICQGANIRVACTALLDVHINLLVRYTLQYQSSAAYARKAAICQSLSVMGLPAQGGPRLGASGAAQTTRCC